jgi:hypothetical protein
MEALWKPSAPRAPIRPYRNAACVVGKKRRRTPAATVVVLLA